MKHISNFELFLEENNQNTPQGYINSLSKKPVLKPVLKPNQNNQKPNEQKPTDEVDTILQDTEAQKQQIITKKDMIEKGLLNNIQQLEPQNQKDVQTQVNDYKNQVKEFDKTVQQIGKLNQTLKKSNVKPVKQQSIQNARQQNNF
jgi:soluble cytochrome b562